MESSTTSQLPDEAKNSSDAPTADTIARGYETTHLNVRPLLFVLGGLFFLTAGIYVAVWYLQDGLLRGASAGDRPTSMIRLPERQDDAPLLQPSGPIHDTTAAQDLAAMRAGEDAIFSKIGWRQADSGEVAVPDEIVKGLAARPVSRPASGDGGVK